MFVQPNANDFLDYKKLLVENLPPAQPSEQLPTEQTRWDVQKDFWTEERHIRIKSPLSHLWIYQRKDKFEMEEHMPLIECCFQDLTSSATQEIRWLTAKDSICTYPAYSFDAKEANLQTFSLPYTTFPSTLPTEPPHGWAYADTLHWVWQDTLNLTGNVRLFSQDWQQKATFALADALSWIPKTGQVELVSHAPNKVLLWQDELRLSSPSLEMEINPKNHKEQIKAMGDVHFYFSGEEEATFYKTFGIK